MRDYNDRVVVDLPRWAFDEAVLSALEKDTGAVPIMGEIIRLLKIKQKKFDNIRNTDVVRAKNLEIARESK